VDVVHKYRAEVAASYTREMPPAQSSIFVMEKEIGPLSSSPSALL
jgi:hypothetical protein